MPSDTDPSSHTYRCIHTNINMYTHKKRKKRKGRLCASGFAVSFFLNFLSFFLRIFSDILRLCGPYSYNSYHIFSHIAITEDQEEDEEDEDSDYMAYVHISSILDG